MLRRLLVLACCLVMLVAVDTGCAKKKKKKKKGDTTEQVVKNVKDRVEIELDDDGFHPDRIPALRGRPITLVFTRTDDDACGTAVVIAEENLRRDLPLDQPVQIVLMPSHQGRIRFACPNGKHGGDLEVQ